ncbi:MAG: hypothetical protein ACK4NO_08235 [Glycocaulis sp.]
MRERPGHPFDHETAQPADAPVNETRKLRKTGNSYGVTLSKAALDAAGFSPDHPVAVIAEPGRVIIRSAGGAYDDTVEAGREALAQYRFALEALAR